MLTLMMPAAEILTRARHGAGLSVRTLAARAGVPASTVTRIEHGRVDPTWTTLAKLLAAAGTEVTTTRPLTPLTALSTAWVDDGGAGAPDWTRVRAWLAAADHAPRTALAAALAAPPRRGTHPVLANLLAGLAEHLSDAAGHPAPAWTTRVRPLPQAWSAPGTPRMVQAWRASTPPALAARNLIVDAATLVDHAA